MLHNRSRRSHADPCLYYKDWKGEGLLASETIDNIFITVPRDEIIELFINLLKNKNKITDLGHQSYLLDWTVRHNPNGDIHLSQLLLIKKTIQNNVLSDSSTRKTTLQSKPDWNTTEQTLPLNEKLLCQSTIGDI